MLIIIPARGGSKGIPGKNLKFLGGKPLILYTFELARKLAEVQDICLSSDHNGIIELAKQNGLPVMFTRPSDLATDTADMYDVIMHSINQFEASGKFYDSILLLQPTSPFRSKEDIQRAMSLFNENIDMVVSVKKSICNPDALFYDNPEGYLVRYSGKMHQRRQDLDQFYSYNGAVYLMNSLSLHKMHYREFKKIVKLEMDEYRSLDLDNPFDWDLAEFLIEKKIIDFG
jgi:N-acylneuraminate cytidylyltransferase